MKGKYYRSLSYLVNWIDLPRPIDWVRQFGGKEVIWVEIGFGQGHYLTREAKNNPHVGHVGIESSWIPVRMALRKLQVQGITNVRILFVDAGLAFKRLFAQESIGAIRCLFPCPWPKQRHQKRRLFSREFLRLINSRLKVGGTLTIVTDDEKYSEWIKANNHLTGFELTESLEPPMYGTKYEKKWLEMGQGRFYHLQLRKKEHCFIGVAEDLELQNYKIAEFSKERFTLFSHEGDIIVKAEELVCDPERQIFMMRFLVAEDNFVQHLWVELRKENGYWKLRPSKGSMYVPTKGVQLTLDLLYQRICGEQPSETR